MGQQKQRVGHPAACFGGGDGLVVLRVRILLPDNLEAGIGGLILMAHGLAQRLHDFRGTADVLGRNDHGGCALACNGVVRLAAHDGRQVHRHLSSEGA